MRGWGRGRRLATPSRGPEGEPEWGLCHNLFEVEYSLGRFSRGCPKAATPGSVAQPLRGWEEEGDLRCLAGQLFPGIPGDKINAGVEKIKPGEGKN